MFINKKNLLFCVGSSLLAMNVNAGEYDVGPAGINGSGHYGFASSAPAANIHEIYVCGGNNIVSHLRVKYWDDNQNLITNEWGATSGWRDRQGINSNWKWGCSTTIVNSEFSGENYVSKVSGRSHYSGRLANLAFEIKDDNDVVIDTISRGYYWPSGGNISFFDFPLGQDMDIVGFFGKHKNKVGLSAIGLTIKTNGLDQADYELGPAGNAHPSYTTPFSDNLSDFSSIHMVEVCDGSDMVAYLKISYFDTNGDVKTYGQRGYTNVDHSSAACQTLVVNETAEETGFISSISGTTDSSGINSLTISALPGCGGDESTSITVGYPSGLPFTFEGGIDLQIIGTHGRYESNALNDNGIQELGVIYRKQ